jgi:hypothetical protein
MGRRKRCLLTGMCYKYGQRSQRTHHVKDKQYHAFSIDIDPDTVRDIFEIASLLGIEPRAIVADALDDWMRCIAPVRLEAALAALDGGTATLRDRSAKADAPVGAPPLSLPQGPSAEMDSHDKQKANGPRLLPAKRQ